MSALNTDALIEQSGARRLIETSRKIYFLDALHESTTTLNLGEAPDSRQPNLAFVLEQLALEASDRHERQHFARQKNDRELHEVLGTRDHPTGKSGILLCPKNGAHPEGSV